MDLFVILRLSDCLLLLAASLASFAVLIPALAILSALLNFYPPLTSVP